MVSSAKKTMGTQGFDNLSVMGTWDVASNVEGVWRCWGARFFMVCFLRVDVAK